MIFSEDKREETMKTKIFFMAGIVLLASQLLVLAATAQVQNPALDEKLTLRLGLFWGNFDATVKAYGQDLDVDESMAADDVDFAINGLWRITPRLRIEAAYSGISKSSSDGLANPLNLGSFTVPAGTSLDGEFETQVLRLAAGYAFMRTDTTELGVDLGINYTTVKESFRVDVPGLPSAKINTLDVSEPLPTIGIFFNHAFTSELYLTSHFGAFAFEIGDVDGTIFDFFGGIEYRPWQHAGIGLAYIYTTADLTITDDGVKNDIEYDYNGPMLYLVVGF